MDETQTKVLLVEDNPGDARLLEEIFRDAKQFAAEIRTATRLGQAFGLIKQYYFDVILLDLSLPDSSGLETLTSMLEHAPDVPIILLTGLSDESTGVDALKQGAQDYLIKGEVDSNLIVRSIRYAIERKRLLVEMEKARQFEQHLAYHDVLTNLPNRLLFSDRLNQALVHAKRYSGMVAVLFIDLDGFKSINDRMGHATGDRLLQSVALRLNNCTRESDTIARLGGDEFTILLQGLKRPEDVPMVTEKILNHLAQPFTIDSQNFFMTSSIGVSIFPFDGEDAETLLKKADFAMYRAKSDGKNNYQLFNSAMDSKAAQRLSLEGELGKAIKNGDLFIQYQPQVSLSSGEIIGGEALVRWQHPTRGLMMPSDFIPLAEESGLIVPIGEWVLKTVCADRKRWQEEGARDLPVSVNLSARQFREMELAETIATILKKAALPAHALMLEITESSAMQDVDFTIEVLNDLKALGVKIALDDFGAGYSSLNYLRRLPIDLLKIDKSFMTDIPGEPEDASIIAAIVAMTRSLGMKVIAEGVETAGQIEFLRSIQCDRIQGFYFSRPVPEPQFKKLMQSNSRLPMRGQSCVEVKVIE